MLKTLLYICLSSVLTVSSSNNNYASLPDKVKKELRHRWDLCCKSNTCIYNSCYFVRWSPSGWSTVRQRCQSEYPEWPFIIDLFRIQREEDLQTFWNMLQNPTVPRREKPKAVWTNGVRCPKGPSKERKYENRWISTNEPFPTWLEERLNTTDISSKHPNNCEYLVLYPAQNNEDAKYDFQHQNAYHSAICEFTVPDAEWTTQDGTSTQSAGLKSTTTKEVELLSSSSSTRETRKTIATTVENSDSTEDAQDSSELNPQWETSTFHLTTNSPGYCEAVNKSGISWPKTEAGKQRQMKCPEPMIGYAEWECNKSTLRFEPDKPNLENCKHQWLDHLEKAIQEGEDPVHISTKLANETKHNKMSHGDIIAIVNLTSSLFRLYMEEYAEEEFEEAKTEEEQRYYNFTQTMISSISNILTKESKDAWEELNGTRQTKEASSILKLVTTIGRRLSCIRTSDDKLQITVSKDNIDLQTFILNNTSGENDVVRFPQETETVKANSYITLPANLQLENWSPLCKRYSSAVGIIYKQVGDFLKNEQNNSADVQVVTDVLSFSVSNRTQSISIAEGKVNITLRHLTTKESEIRNQNLWKPKCVFWNFSKSEFGEWDVSGCILLSYNKTHTECQCDHLTNFAVLMDINDNVGDNHILTWLTYVCCGLSCISLFLTLICLIAIRSLHGRRSIITGNLCISLLITNGIVLFGLDKTQYKGDTAEIICSIVAGVLHYWVLSAFCWMLVEGYHLYRMVILVFQRGSNMPVLFYYLFAYGSPLIIVGVSAFVRREGYGGPRYCWLSTNDKGLIWSFVGPACLIIFVNLIIFVLTLRSASSVKIKREQSTVKKIRGWIRGSISVMCLLGITWCIGLIYMHKNFHFFAYIFTVLNGLQGVFIFLFHILLNDKVQSYFFCKENSKYGKRKFFNHTSSNQTHSKTSTRTSLGFISSTKQLESTIVKKSQPYNVSSSRNKEISNGHIEVGEDVRNNHKNHLSRATSGGGPGQTSFYNSNVKLRSQSASSYGLSEKSQISQKSYL